MRSYVWFLLPALALGAAPASGQFGGKKVDGAALEALKGVEDGKPAFEKAGIKNAIICREAPEKTEDPNWDAEDARYSVIRWAARNRSPWVRTS